MFLKWSLPSLNLDLSLIQKGKQSVTTCNDNYKKKANNIDPDETAYYEPANLDLHYLHRYLFCSVKVVGWCEGAVYLTSPGRPTDIGLQLGKACYPCSG